MNSSKVRVQVKPHLEIKNAKGNLQFTAEREKTFTVDPEKPLKEVGIEMMKNLGFLGLDHLSKVTKVFVRPPSGAFTPLDGHIPDFNKNIGDLQQHVHGGFLVIKSDLTGKSEDYGKADMDKTICRSLLKYLI